MLPTWALYQVIHRSALSQLFFYIPRIQTAFCFYYGMYMFNSIFYVQLHCWSLAHSNVHSNSTKKNYNKKQIQERECWIYWVSEWDGDIKKINDFPFQLVLLMFERSKRKKAAAVAWVESINKEINYCLKHFDNKFRNWMRNWKGGNGKVPLRVLWLIRDLNCWIYTILWMFKIFGT